MSGEASAAVAEVSTPGTKTAEAVASLLGRPLGEIGKILFFRADGKLVGAMLRGNHSLNESKLLRHLKASEVALAEPSDVERELGVPVGFIGPVGLKGGRIVADRELASGGPIVTGANKADFHLTGVVPGRDFPVSETAQLRDVEEGDSCPKCGEELKTARGIEVGHIFMLGDKYSKSMGATFLDSAGKERVSVMGCYGIGITRIVAAAIEQNHDDKGIVWPKAIAPYRAVILPLGADPGIISAAEALYNELREAGIEVLLDDREETPGVKFNDADLLGMPFQAVIGKAFKASGMVEIKARTGEKENVAPGEVKARLLA